MAGQQLPAGFVPDAAPAAAAPAGFVPDGFVPDFKASNDPIQATQLLANQREDDAAAAEKAKPSWLALGAEAVKGLASGLNPLPILEAMYGETAGHFTRAADAAKRGEYGEMAGELFSSSGAPVEALVKATVGAHWQQFVKAKKAYDAGRYSEAAGYTAAGMLPLLGPMAAQSGEDIGSGDPRTMARGVGEGAAAIRPQLPLEIAGGVMRGAVGGVSAAARRVVGGINLNAAEAASNAFADARGIPKDLATATGSKWARAAQKRVANSMGGEAVAAEMIKDQRDNLARVGGELADETNGIPGAPGAATKPIDAGEGVQGSIKSLITQLHDEASKSYGELRKAEETASPDTVPVKPAPVDALKDWQKAQLRRIVHEMDGSGFVQGKLQRNSLDDSGTTYQARSGGAAVYHDIQEHGGAGLDRGELQAELDDYLGGGKETAAVKGALEVARQRYMGNPKLSTPELPPSAMSVPTRLEVSRAQSQQMQMAIDLTSIKKVLKPIRDRMGAGAEIAPLMGAKADAFRALTRIIDGPDHAPLSVVDEALGDLKSLARGGKNGPVLPELRTAGQGTAAYAVSRLDALVRARAAQAGPDVLRALETGRNMTREKVAVGDLFETLRQEPVQAFEQLTAPQDKGFHLLRKISDIAPMQMQDVARAWLEKQLDLAKQEGGFGHADKMWSNWNALGPQTKRILFSAPGQTQALDHFFLLAKRLAENPNPSGTAHTLTAINVGSVPVMAGLAKMLYTKKGVDAITRWMAAQSTPGATAAAAGGRAARAAAWTALRVSAARAGVTLPAAVPMAADADEQR